MSNLNKTPLKVNSQQDDSDDNSDDNLKIVLDSPKPKRKLLKPEPSKSEKQIIDSIEDELEQCLDERAAKMKLNAMNVKNIIKHVVTNEHVLAMVKKAEDPNAWDDSVPYEPKLTRAKAKELLSTVSIPSVPWATPKSTSEVHVLFNEDLQEDSSGDEYIPCEEESEDDRDSSMFSDPPSIPPPATTPNSDLNDQTNWTEDGVFKIPSSKFQGETEEEANIARRTRSKLCLTSTPLEVIEEAFIPPDITTDMYDMECDNEDWMDFLKKFTRPLDEIAKATEDEEQDPEYNILADEEIDEVDKEELRVDKAVKVTRKELNDLVAELFECSEFCSINDVDMAEPESNMIKNSIIQQGAKPDIIEAAISKSLDQTDLDRTEMADIPEESVKEGVNNPDDIEGDYSKRNMITMNQIPLLEQQMLQHVQMLTQNFILTYKHLELHHCSVKLKEYLLNLKLLGEGKTRSAFFARNLSTALELVKYWEDLLESNSEEVKQMQEHVEKVLSENIRRRKVGSHSDYIVSFPPLILQTISRSEVFLYPSLLAKIPFKSPKVFPKYTNTYTESEDGLIALGLEQFTHIVKQDRRNFTKVGEIKLKVLCAYIQEYMMPHRETNKIYYHVLRYKLASSANNPIKYYFQNGRPPPVIHYIYTLDQLQVLPPCKRSPDELPYQWKIYIYPGMNPTVVTRAQIVTAPIAVPIAQVSILNLPDNKQFNNQRQVRALLPKVCKSITSAPPVRRKRSIHRRKSSIINAKKPKEHADPITRFVECLSRPSHVQRLRTLYQGSISDMMDMTQGEKGNSPVWINAATISEMMMPSMPYLGTPIKNPQLNEVESSTDGTSNKNQQKVVISASTASSGSTKGESLKNTYLDFSTISSTSFQQPDSSTEVEFCNPSDSSQTVTTTSILSSVTSSQAETETSTHSEVQGEVGFCTNSDVGKDNPEEISALMAASSTVKTTIRKEPSGAEKKRAKLRREFLANLSVATPEDQEVAKKKNEMFALAYYDKMRETLELSDYHKIMQILNDHEQGDAVDLYIKVEKVLSPKYQQLADEFLIFLREKEARAVGQLVPWILMRNRSEFLRKLEIYFKDQPGQLKKIYKCLMDLTRNVDVSMDKIKGTLLPMFKGNAVLSDLFLKSFLDETPPPSLLDEPYETIDITKEMSRSEGEEIFESITVPDVEDKYGGPSCICSCHQIEDPDFKSRYRHCIRCGTRFVNGKVYIQTGRGLRPATVTFLTNPNTDHNIRLMGKPTTTHQKKKRSDSSPSKQAALSPTKDNPEEESEDDMDGKKKTKKKSPKRKKPSEKTRKSSKDSQNSTTTKKSATGKGGNASAVGKEFKSGSRKRAYSMKKSKAKDDIKTEIYEEAVLAVPSGAIPEQVVQQVKQEYMEWEDNNVIADSADIKPNSSPGQQTAESESEFCEESSQDNCESDSNSSISSSNNQSQSDSNAGEESSWKREEDKIILETFQKENDKAHAFKIISKRLKNRTASQISDRFQTLMTLLLETLGNS